jgi:hypothetical protein
MQAEGLWQQGKELQTLSAVPIIMSFCLGLRFSLLRSASSCSMPPLTMIFCLSGGTPVRLYSWFLNTSPGIVVSTSTSWLSLPHLTLTCTIVLVSAWGTFCESADVWYQPQSGGNIIRLLQSKQTNCLYLTTICCLIQTAVRLSCNNRHLLLSHSRLKTNQGTFQELQEYCGSRYTVCVCHRLLCDVLETKGIAILSARLAYFRLPKVLRMQICLWQPGLC